MRTTLDIDDDVLDAAKELSRRQKVSAGKVVSQLVRQALSGQGQGPGPGSAAQAAAVTVGGFRPFAARGVVVSDDLVNALRDVEGV